MIGKSAPLNCLNSIATEKKKKKDKKFDFFWLRTTEVQKDLQFLELQIEERAEILFFTCIFIQVAFIEEENTTLHVFFLRILYNLGSTS